MGKVLQKCTSRDAPQLMRLLGEQHRYNPRLQELDYFEWQFKGGPFARDDEYNLCMVTNDSGICSVLGYVPAEFWHKGAVITGCWPQNWGCVSGDYSGLTVLSRVMAEYDNLFYCGMTDQTVNIFTKLDIPILMEIPRWIGILDCQELENLFGIPSPHDKEMLCRSQTRLKALDGKTHVFRCERFDPQQEFTLDHWPEIVGYSRRTGAYLNWRYVDIPRHNYKLLQSDTGQFAVYRVETIKFHSEAVIRILEWSFTDEAAIHAMRMILDDASQHSAIMLDFLCTAEIVGLELEKLGFLRAEQLHLDIPCLFRPIKRTKGISVAIDMPPHRTKRHLNFSKWYITKGDTDIDRIKL